jgi:MarR-like DNA-binding transcriptional regulator SgrR of sgrS sRNA
VDPQARKGVQFHDGKEMTSADVVYSLNRHKDPKVGSIAKTLAVQMQEIKAIGLNEVQITLTGPNADLPVVLGTFHFKIIKEGVTDFTAAIGTGAYKCKEFSPGELLLQKPKQLGVQVSARLNAEPLHLCRSDWPDSVKFRHRQ